jgi:hypothetical protein
VVRAENGAPIQEVLAQYAQPAPAPASPKAPTHQEVMKIYLKNGGYKSVVVTSEHTCVSSSLVAVHLSLFIGNIIMRQFSDCFSS